MALGANIRALRTALGWSARTLSEKTGNKVGVSTIGNLEQRNSKSSPYVSEIAAAFDLSADDLMKGDAAALVVRVMSPASPPRSPTHRVSELMPTYGVLTTRQIIDRLGEALDQCTTDSRAAVAGLLQQYALSPKPGAIADAIVMLLERCANPNADNPFAAAPPVTALPAPSPKRNKQ